MISVLHFRADAVMITQMQFTIALQRTKNEQTRRENGGVPDGKTAISAFSDRKKQKRTRVAFFRDPETARCRTKQGEDGFEKGSDEKTI
jgi:hypothetical protein